MYETRRFELPYAGCVTCQLVRVLRDHHDSMVGDDRGRPGWDRVLLRLQSGEEVIADVWTRSGESIADAPQWIALRDDGEIVYWLPAEPGAANDDALELERVAVANDGHSAAGEVVRPEVVVAPDVEVDSKPGVTKRDRIRALN